MFDDSLFRIKLTSMNDFRLNSSVGVRDPGPTECYENAKGKDCVAELKSKGLKFSGTLAEQRKRLIDNYSKPYLTQREIMLHGMSGPQLKKLAVEYEIDTKYIDHDTGKKKQLKKPGLLEKLKQFEYERLEQQLNDDNSEVESDCYSDTELIALGQLEN